MTTTPFAATVEHLAGRLVDQRVALAASWLEQLKRIVPVDAHDVFPTPTLLDHIPELIARIGLDLRVSDAQALGANDAIMLKATELGLLRFDQRAPVGQLLREYEVFSEIPRPLLEPGNRGAGPRRRCHGSRAGRQSQPQGGARAAAAHG